MKTPYEQKKECKNRCCHLRLVEPTFHEICKWIYLFLKLVLYSIHVSFCWMWNAVKYWIICDENWTKFVVKRKVSRNVTGEMGNLHKNEQLRYTLYLCVNRYNVSGKGFFPDIKSRFLVFQAWLKFVPWIWAYSFPKLFID